MSVDKLLLAELQVAAHQSGLKPIISVRQAAEFASVHHRTVRRWIRSKRLRATKTHPGQRGEVRIVLASLLELLAQSGGTAASYRLPNGTSVGAP